jgi:GMP synthase (glutamine-hydrolysing)
MDSILMVVHQETSSPGLVGDKLRSRGYTLDIRCPALGDDLPATLEHHQAVVVFGGPMSANDGDTLPFIRTELDWIAQVVLPAHRPYLGICLGAQLLARALGAAVNPHPDDWREIGYYPLHSTAAGQDLFPPTLQVYHWHGEGFDLPTGAIALATGDAFANQAFRYGDRAYGLQFHPEITATLIDEWTTRGVDQLPLPGAQSRDQQLQGHGHYAPQVDQWLDRFLEHWLQAAPWEQRASA